MSSRWGAPHQPPISSNDVRGGGGEDSRRSDRGYQQDGMRGCYSTENFPVILKLI